MVWSVGTEGEGTESDRRACGHPLPMRQPLSYITRAAPHSAFSSMDRALHIHRPGIVEPVTHSPLVPSLCTVYIRCCPAARSVPCCEFERLFAAVTLPSLFPLIKRPPAASNMGRVKRTSQELSEGPSRFDRRRSLSSGAGRAAARTAAVQRVAASGAPASGTVGEGTAGSVAAAPGGTVQVPVGTATGTRGRAERLSATGTAADLPPPYRRYRPGTAVLREIRPCPRPSNLLIRRLPFQRLVREVAADVQANLRLDPIAVDTLQHAVEDYMVQIFKDSVLCATHAKRVTVTLKDLRLAMRIRGDRFRF